MLTVIIISSIVILIAISSKPCLIWHRQQACIHHLSQLKLEMPTERKTETEILIGITKVFLKSINGFLKRVQGRTESLYDINRHFKHINKEIDFIEGRFAVVDPDYLNQIKSIREEIESFQKLFNNCQLNFLLRYR